MLLRSTEVKLLFNRFVHLYDGLSLSFSFIQSPLQGGAQKWRGFGLVFFLLARVRWSRLGLVFLGLGLG